MSETKAALAFQFVGTQRTRGFVAYVPADWVEYLRDPRRWFRREDWSDRPRTPEVLAEALIQSWIDKGFAPPEFSRIRMAEAVAWWGLWHSHQATMRPGRERIGHHDMTMELKRGISPRGRPAIQVALYDGMISEMMAPKEQAGTTAEFVAWFAPGRDRSVEDAKRLQQALKDGGVTTAHMLAELSGARPDEAWTLENARYDEPLKTWLCRRGDEWAALHADGSWRLVDNEAGIGWWQRIIDYWKNAEPPPVALTLVFINRRREELSWRSEITPEQVKDLRTVPERLPEGFVEPGNDIDQQVLRCIQMLVQFTQRAHDELLPNARVRVSEIISWWVIWRRAGGVGDRELAEIAGRVPITIEFRDTGTGQCEISVFEREYVAPDAKPILARPQFAQLAEAALRYLANPKDAKLLQPDIVEEFQKAGLCKVWNPRVRERLFAPGFRQLTTELREADKIVFDRDFSALVCETAQQPPDRLLQLLATSRWPFQQCWIEWDRSTCPDLHKVPSGDFLLGRWGILVHPTSDAHRVAASVVYPGDQCFVPGTLFINFREPIGNIDGQVRYSAEIDNAQAQMWLVLVKSWVESWGEAGAAAALELASHARVALGWPPYGKWIRNLLGGYRNGTIEQYFAEQLLMAGSVFREVLAGCALVATHIGGNPLVGETRGKGKSTYYRGKFHPPIEYKVLQLARPMPAPRLFRRLFLRHPAAPTRHHRVIGAWHHRSAPNAVCGHHPRACMIAFWRPFDDLDLEDYDAEYETGDLQACRLCLRRRWYVIDHARGNPELGIIDKVYEITATKRARRSPRGKPDGATPPHRTPPRPSAPGPRPPS